MRNPLALLCFLFALAAGPAQCLELDLPLDCPASGCFVQQYVDMDPGPEARDYACGSLAYPGHKGTDFRISPEAMRRGVLVRAAAPGKVAGTRDGMPDAVVDRLGARALAGREAGNGVRIDHGGGWTTQYSHMKRGSIRVRTGDEVVAGQPLGEVGLSGMTEFPHLELAVRANATVIDPFTGRPAGTGCGPGAPLWSLKARPMLGYKPTGMVGAGFTQAPPAIDQARLLPQGDAPLPANATAMVFWTLAYGVRKGDVEHVALYGPDGQVLARMAKTVPAGKMEWLRYLGLPNKTGRFAPGRYSGRYTLYRVKRGLLEKVAEARAEVAVPKE